MLFWICISFGVNFYEILLVPQLTNVAINSVFSFSLQPLRIAVFKKCTAIRIKNFLRALLVHFNRTNYGRFSKSWIAVIVCGICRSSLLYRYSWSPFHCYNRSSLTAFYFIIFYHVRRRYCFCPWSEGSGRKLTKTLLWYVAPAQKYVQRIIYFHLFRATQAPLPEQMRASYRKEMFQCICGRKWRVLNLVRFDFSVEFSNSPQYCLGHLEYFRSIVRSHSCFYRNY